ncbi:hypothetical protein CRV24_004540 [Beauveria bassiana]|nr:hypothetical protein CRV24_004540 [Beauveria bassiana]KAH8711175.1 hypothetical protein HC256_007991 [Beauveria bassiana]
MPSSGIYRFSQTTVLNLTFDNKHVGLISWCAERIPKGVMFRFDQTKITDPDIDTTCAPFENKQPA